MLLTIIRPGPILFEHKAIYQTRGGNYPYTIIQQCAIDCINNSCVVSQVSLQLMDKYMWIIVPLRAGRFSISVCRNGGTYKSCVFYPLFMQSNNYLCNQTNDRKWYIDRQHNFLHHRRSFKENHISQRYAARCCQICHVNPIWWDEYLVNNVRVKMGIKVCIEY